MNNNLYAEKPKHEQVKLSAEMDSPAAEQLKYYDEAQVNYKVTFTFLWLYNLNFFRNKFKGR